MWASIAATMSAAPQPENGGKRIHYPSETDDTDSKNGKRQRRMSPSDLTSDRKVPQDIAVQKEDHLSSDALAASSDTEEAKRNLYLQRVFLPRLNRILKKAGLPHGRGMCRKWNTILQKD
jgi:hypothetical protein